jgi:outer membrane protein assembly factor BamB
MGYSVKGLSITPNGTAIASTNVAIWSLDPVDGKINYFAQTMGPGVPQQPVSILPGPGSSAQERHDGAILYVPCNNGITAFRARDGAKLWGMEDATSHYAAPTVGTDGLVFAAANNGTIRALDQQTGTVVWSDSSLAAASSSSGLVTSILTNDGHIMYGTYDGLVTKRLAIDGTHVWTVNISVNADTRNNAQSALLDSAGSFRAIQSGNAVGDPDSLARIGSDETIHPSIGLNFIGFPTFAVASSADGRRIYTKLFFSGTMAFIAIDTDTGDELFSLTGSGSQGNVVLSASEQTVFLIPGSGDLLAIDAYNGTVLWTRPGTGSQSSAFMAMAADGSLFIPGATNLVHHVVPYSQVAFGANSTAVSVAENAGPAILNVSRVGMDVSSAFIAIIELAGISATAGADFTSQQRINATFAAGQTMASIAVPIVFDDGVYMEPDEVIRATIVEIVVTKPGLNECVLRIFAFFFVFFYNIFGLTKKKKKKKKKKKNKTQNKTATTACISARSVQRPGLRLFLSRPRRRAHLRPLSRQQPLLRAGWSPCPGRIRHLSCAGLSQCGGSTSFAAARSCTRWLLVVRRRFRSATRLTPGTTGPRGTWPAAIPMVRAQARPLAAPGLRCPRRVPQR